MYGGKIDKDVIYYLKKYEKKFKEGMPLMIFNGTKEDLINEIKNCLASGKEYDISFYLDDEIES